LRQRQGPKSLDNESKGKKQGGRFGFGRKKKHEERGGKVNS